MKLSILCFEQRKLKKNGLSLLKLSLSRRKFINISQQQITDSYVILYNKALYPNDLYLLSEVQ